MALDTVLKQQPLITRVAVDSTEDSHTLREKTRAFLVRCQDYEEIRLAFVSGGTANSGGGGNSGKYLVLRMNDVYWEEDVYSAGEQWTIYLRAPDAASAVGVTVLEWV